MRVIGLCEDTRASSLAVRIPIAGLCGNAGTRAPDRRRTQERHTFASFAGVEAESFTRLAATAKKRQRATVLAVLLPRAGSAGLLAAPVL